MLDQIELGDIAAIATMGVTAVGVLAAFMQISELQRENGRLREERERDREAQKQNLTRQEAMAWFQRDADRAVAEDGYAKPVLTTVLQLQALCLYLKQILERHGAPTGRFAHTEMKVTTDGYLCELRAYEKILSVLFGNFGTSPSVTSILMRAQKYYYVLIADLTQLMEHQEVALVHKTMQKRLGNAAENFDALVDMLDELVSLDVLQAIRKAEFEYNHLDEYGVLKKDAPTSLVSLDGATVSRTQNLTHPTPAL